MSQKDKLLVIWSTADREVTLNNAFMYTYNSKVHGWWQQVRLLVWGPSAKLVLEDVELQQEITKMLEAGVEVIACKACSDRYGVSGQLAGLGIKVFYVGEALTEMLKEDWATLTY